VNPGLEMSLIHLPRKQITLLLCESSGSPGQSKHSALWDSLRLNVSLAGPIDSSGHQGCKSLSQCIRRAQRDVAIQ
jgi:hypothetical protein